MDHSLWPNISSKSLNTNLTQNSHCIRLLYQAVKVKYKAGQFSLLTLGPPLVVNVAVECAWHGRD